MPKFEVTLEGSKTLNYSYTTVIEAKDEAEAWDKAYEIDPKQSDWVLEEFDDISDNEIQYEGVDDVTELEDEEQEIKSVKKYVK